MNYPIPKNAELFFQFSETESTNTNKLLKDRSKICQNNSFSRDKKSDYINEYIKEIKRLESTFKSIPFVKQIFLCNSLSFNALDENSDIDLFIITES